ncbi:protein late bloomer-like [Musca domestica]|uniref:Protein late bloomer-like n=1 Tax=Musca domestica TaxID=7370 RepID=T1PC85_MUSDO|nr:protein late bloomer-like [Musca domestica]XP_058976351.1 protein late bloomer-like [Musca domestica]XP_058976352.1 protein late bloomer-like [Musca domestica]XP_058976353.1 protein late bloomer-like [Musca domestica]XP_058976354.1 protein late bloomer-like [Musca domestica]
MASKSAVKRFIYIFDILCILLASVLIGFGAYVICTNETNEIGTMGAYGYIAIGVATFVVFIFLNVGAMRDNVCCTVTFIVLMVLIIFAQGVVAFFMIAGRESVASNLANELDATWEKELKNHGAMSIYENWFDCCGRASPQDYIVAGRLPPPTCFVGHDISLPENLIESGCRIKFEDYWLELLGIFNILACVLIGLELILSFIACCLCVSIRNERRRSYY